MKKAHCVSLAAGSRARAWSRGGGRFTHLTQHVRQVPGPLRLQGLGHQGVQADAGLPLAFLLVLHLAAEETQSEANTPGRKGTLECLFVLLLILL